jgi:hypothetical protein
MWCSLDLSSGDGEHVVHRYDGAHSRWEAREKEAWRLTSRAPATKDLATTHAGLKRVVARYLSYMTCLVANLQSEVPLLVPDDRVVFLSCDATIPGISNEMGTLVQNLRYHFAWKHVWNVTQWEGELQRIAKRIDEVLRSVEAIDEGGLLSREAHSHSLLEAWGGKGFVKVTPVIDEVRHLLSEGASRQAKAVLDRWRNQEFLRADEVIELDRLEIVVLLSENRAVEGLRLAELLVKQPMRTAQDIALAARCAHDAHDYTRAATLMHHALDEGASVDEVRTVALRIAGHAGDKLLADRVRT